MKKTIPIVQKREAHLYGISGWFSQEVYNIPKMAFGGYFRHDVLDSIIADGQIVDAWGESTIEGQMSNGVLEFRKTYTVSGTEIDYLFRKQGDIWVGTYVGAAVGKGSAACSLVVASKDAFDIACGPMRSSRQL